MTTVNVCMVTFNHKRYISRAIESVLSQERNFSLRLHVSDDCSTDGTSEIVQHYGRAFPETVVATINQTNLGPHSNFSKTFESCQGEYVALLEGDDLWCDTTKLMRQVAIMQSRPELAITGHRVRLIDSNGKAMRVLPRGRHGDRDIRDLYRENFLLTCSVMYRRSLCPELPAWLFECPIGDWPLHIYVAQYGGVHILNEVLGEYRVHDSGIWSGLPESVRVSRTIATLRKVLESIDLRDESFLRRSIAIHTAHLAFSKALEGDDVAAANTLDLLESEKRMVTEIPVTIRTAIRLMIRSPALARTCDRIFRPILMAMSRIFI